MKYYLIAGEKSGDLHGSNLMKSLKDQDEEAGFRFFGGDLMHASGGELVIHYKQLAVMGFWEVIIKIRKISKFISLCKNDLLNYQPDVIILIDFAGFNLRIAQFAKQQGFKVFYYISPKIWAWNTSRALKIKKYVDRMFVILPFEKDFYQKYNWEVDYVGNPVLESVDNFIPDQELIQEFQKIKKPLIAALPGSRQQEIKQMMPLFTEIMNSMRAYHFLVAKVNSVPDSLYNPVRELPNVSLIEERSYNILSVAHSALINSGTATLETALFNVPQVVVYKTGALSYQIAKSVIKVPFISLVNLIFGQELVKELIQYDCTVENIKSELKNLENESHRDEILAGYEKIREIIGTQNASKSAATLMVNYLK